MTRPFNNAVRDLEDSYSKRLAPPRSNNTYQVQYWGPPDHCRAVIPAELGASNADNELALVTKTLEITEQSTTRQNFKISYKVCGFENVLTQHIMRTGSNYTSVPISRILNGESAVDSSFLDHEEEFIHTIKVTNRFSGSINQQTPTSTFRYSRDSTGRKRSTFHINGTQILLQTWDYKVQRFFQKAFFPFLASFEWRIVGEPTLECDDASHWFEWPNGFLRIYSDRELLQGPLSLFEYSECFDQSASNLRNSLRENSRTPTFALPREPVDPTAQGIAISSNSNEELIDEFESIIEILEDGLISDAINELNELIEFAEDNDIQDNR